MFYRKWEVKSHPCKLNSSQNRISTIQKMEEESMKRNDALKVINPLLGIFLVNQVLTGLLNKSLPHEVFEVLHKGGGILFTIAAILHVTMNWNWIKANFLPKSPKIKT